jgi:hypothetical protein
VWESGGSEDDELSDSELEVSEEEAEGSNNSHSRAHGHVPVVQGTIVASDKVVEAV